MKKYHFILYVALAIIVVLGLGASFLVGDRHALQNMTIAHATPDQIANAMEGDYFYSNYRENTLIVQGVVASVDMQNGSQIIGFKTSSSYQALCTMSTPSSTIKVGDNITILTEGPIAERESTAVMLVGCLAL
jgi:hypothetical protein